MQWDENKHLQFIFCSLCVCHFNINFLLVKLKHSIREKIWRYIKLMFFVVYQQHLRNVRRKTDLTLNFWITKDKLVVAVVPPQDADVLLT